MGVIIPATVACVCPERGAVASPPAGTSIELVTGQWRLVPEGVVDDDDAAAWIRGACPHALVVADGWPLASDLQDLSRLSSDVDDPDVKAIAELIAAFGRRPGEQGPLAPLAVDVDPRHARGLRALSERLAAVEAPWLIDSDTDAVVAKPSSFLTTPSGTIAIGRGLIVPPRPGPPYPFFVRFDAAGLQLPNAPDASWSARRIEQRRLGSRTLWTDLDTGRTVEAAGVLVADLQRDTPLAKRLHVDMRPLPDEFLAGPREALGRLVAAAIETGHPICLPDRFGGMG